MRCRRPGWIFTSSPPARRSSTTLLSEERRALAAVVELGAVGIALSPAVISRHRDRIAALRSAGHQVWVEVHPATRAPGVASEDVDGALVMFIEPGTKDSADPTQLTQGHRVERPATGRGGWGNHPRSRCPLPPTAGRAIWSPAAASSP